jgi:hypothetical protein
MLTLLAPPWAAYLVAGVFDAGWAGCLIAEWLLRYDSKRSALPRKAGFAMLTVSMAAITVHGIIAGAWAIGIVGALVSAAAKGVWAIGMHTIRVQLDPKHEAYLRALQQQSGTELALALGERDRLLTEARTVSLKLALEARRPNIPTVVQDTQPEPVKQLPPEPDGPVGEPEAQPIELTAQPVEPTAHLAEPTSLAGRLSTVSAHASTVEPPAPPAGPEAPAFGFSAHLTGQAAQRAKAVAQVAELLAQDSGITSGQVAEELDVSPATAKRYLREARQAK